LSHNTSSGYQLVSSPIGSCHRTFTEMISF
jgi:hypothetical protein